MFTREFGISLVERAIRTFAQALAAVLVASGTGLLDAAWIGALSAAGMAALISVLMTLATGAATGGNPALGGEVLARPGQTADPVASQPVVVEPDPEPRHAVEGSE